MNQIVVDTLLIAETAKVGEAVLVDTKKLRIY